MLSPTLGQGRGVKVTPTCEHHTSVGQHFDQLTFLLVCGCQLGFSQKMNFEKCRTTKMTATDSPLHRINRQYTVGVSCGSGSALGHQLLNFIPIACLEV